MKRCREDAFPVPSTLISPLSLARNIIVCSITFPLKNMRMTISRQLKVSLNIDFFKIVLAKFHKVHAHPGGALGYFLGGYVPPGTPNWHPVLKKNSPKIDTPF